MIVKDTKIIMTNKYFASILSLINNSESFLKTIKNNVVFYFNKIWQAICQTSWAIKIVKTNFFSAI